jgi:hypothetical protein
VEAKVSGSGKDAGDALCIMDMSEFPSDIQGTAGIMEKNVAVYFEKTSGGRGDT